MARHTSIINHHTPPVNVELAMAVVVVGEGEYAGVLLSGTWTAALFYRMTGKQSDTIDGQASKQPSERHSKRIVVTLEHARIIGRRHTM